MPRSIRIAVALTVLAAMLAVPGSALAGKRSFRAVGVDSAGRLVFKVRVEASRLGSATVRVGSYKRKLSRRTVRRALRRGKLRVRVPRKVRRKLRRMALRARPRTQPRPLGKAPAARPAAKVVVVTRDPAPRGIASPDCMAVPSGARYVSPSGDDGNPGTKGEPWRTLDHAEEQSRPGTTVVLRGGDYSARGKSLWVFRNGTDADPITWVAQPGETPKIKGQIGVDGNSRRFCGIVFDGPTGATSNRTPDGEQDKMYVAGDDFELISSEIRGSRWHAGIYLNDAERFRLVGNYVHDNGRFDDPSHANLDHGIYVGSGSGLIENNRIENNYAFGVQLYPNASGVTVRGNRITGNGRAGVIFGEEAAGNQVVDNDIYGNQRGIQAWELTGKGNVAKGNRLWGNREGNLVGLDGIAVTGNVLQ